MPDACGAAVGFGGVPRTLTEPHSSRRGPASGPTIVAEAGAACEDLTRDPHMTPRARGICDWS